MQEYNFKLVVQAALGAANKQLSADRTGGRCGGKQLVRPAWRRAPPRAEAQVAVCGSICLTDHLCPALSGQQGLGHVHVT